MRNLIRKSITGIVVATVSVLLFVGSANADYLYEHDLSSGWNLNKSTLDDTGFCGTSWWWEHNVQTWFNFNGTTGYFSSSQHYLGDGYHPWYGVPTWHALQAFDNYGGLDEDWDIFGYITTSHYSHGLDDTYESDGYSNPIIIRSMFKPISACLTDSFHILYGY